MGGEVVGWWRPTRGGGCFASCFRFPKMVLRLQVVAYKTSLSANSPLLCTTSESLIHRVIYLFQGAANTACMIHFDNNMKPDERTDVWLKYNCFCDWWLIDTSYLRSISEKLRHEWEVLLESKSSILPGPLLRSVVELCRFFFKNLKVQRLSILICEVPH